MNEQIKLQQLKTEVEELKQILQIHEENLDQLFDGKARDLVGTQTYRDAKAQGTPLDINKIYKDEIIRIKAEVKAIVSDIWQKNDQILKLLES